MWAFQRTHYGTPKIGASWPWFFAPYKYTYLLTYLLIWILSRRQNEKTWFSQKLSNLELCCLLTVYRAFQRTSKIRHLGCWRQDAKTRFYGKLSNLERWCQLTTYRKSCNWAFQRTHYWIPKIQDGWDPPSWKSTWGHFFLPRVVRFGWNFETGAEWHVDCGDVVENETRCRILIWRTFGQIQWHVIPEPPW